MNGAHALVEMLRPTRSNWCSAFRETRGLPSMKRSTTRLRHQAYPGRDERSATFMATLREAGAQAGHLRVPSGAGPLYSVPGIAEANASSIR